MLSTVGNHKYKQDSKLKLPNKRLVLFSSGKAVNTPFFKHYNSQQILKFHVSFMKYAMHNIRYNNKKMQ